MSESRSRSQNKSPSNLPRHHYVTGSNKLGWEVSVTGSVAGKQEKR